ncbi:hypothetical protein BBP40_011915 [Aspergillus hancockii]|nr:hypothetical protein BBP40_011915 [Aspergillus hancockii]
MKTSNSTHPVALYWHRTDLRLHDSPGLHAALALKPAVFIPIWTWDPHYVYRARVGPNRWKLLLESQSDLSDSYHKLNPKQTHWVVREEPQTLLPKLWKQWEVTHLVFEKDTDAYARDRDTAVTRLAEKDGVESNCQAGRNLFDPDQIVRRNDGKPTMNMSQVRKAVEKLTGGDPEEVVPTPTGLPDPWDEKKMDLSGLDQDAIQVAPDYNKAYRNADDRQDNGLIGPGRDCGVPTLEEIGIDPSQATTLHKGGETEALTRLDGYIKNDEYVGRFEKP